MSEIIDFVETQQGFKWQLGNHKFKLLTWFLIFNTYATKMPTSAEFIEDFH